MNSKQDDQISIDDAVPRLGQSNLLQSAKVLKLTLGLSEGEANKQDDELVFQPDALAYRSLPNDRTFRIPRAQIQTLSVSLLRNGQTCKTQLLHRYLYM